jgi:hypothetical protein
MTQQISGLVTSQSPEGTWPLAGAVVEVLAEGRPTPVAHTRTDAAGRYVLAIAIEPYTYLAITASRQGYRQPCAATVTAFGHAAVDVQLVPKEKVPASMTASRAPLLSGIAFESTPAGMRPVVSADLYLTWKMGPVIASATTDGEGRYQMCGVPSGRLSLVAVKPGYAPADAAVWFDGEQRLDIELSRP